MTLVRFLNVLALSGCVAAGSVHDGDKSLGSAGEDDSQAEALAVERPGAGISLVQGLASVEIVAGDDGQWSMHLESPELSLTKALTLVPADEATMAAGGPAYILDAADGEPLPLEAQMAFGPIFESAALAHESNPEAFGTSVASINGVHCFWVGVAGGLLASYFGWAGFVGGTVVTWIACAIATPADG